MKMGVMEGQPSGLHSLSQLENETSALIVLSPEHPFAYASVAGRGP